VTDRPGPRPDAADGGIDRRISVAPMMDYTDRHCRYLLRLLTPGALLYTEMVTAHALVHGHVERLLGFDPAEHPVALQLGGADPGLLARAARLGTEFGYDEINLNLGCPSDRVQSGRFGACLMADPATVVECVRAMRESTPLPVTVKCRIGIDELDDYGFFHHFVSVVRESGVDVFIVHARKAYLQGLSPKENREIPPLRYEVVHRLARDFPSLVIVLNGGISDWATIEGELDEADGVMLGRAAYHDPYLLAGVDWKVFGDGRPARARAQVIRDLVPYAQAQLARGTPLRAITRHVLGLYHGQSGGRRFRQILSDASRLRSAGPELLLEALAAVEPVQDAA